MQFLPSDGRYVHVHTKGDGEPIHTLDVTSYYAMKIMILGESGLQYTYMYCTQIRTSTTTVRVKITCPNLCEEYSSCGPYKFTYNIAYAHARRSNGSCTALCGQRMKSSQSLVRGTAIVEAWVY